MKPIDYSQTIMYKLVPKDLNLNLQYVGHTTNFRQRKSQHKRNCTINTKKSNYKVYEMIRANGGWDEWKMIEIEKYPCNDGNEARTRERYWYELYNANLNSRLPICTKQEYTEIHKEEKKLYDKIRRNGKNREIILEKKKIYWKKNRDAINVKRREQRLQKKLEALKLKKNSVGV